MIFVTVGSCDPFDRMVRAVDDWARLRGRTDVFAQIGNSEYKPRHIEAVQFLSPSEFREQVRRAQLLVAHAGMGSVITALEAGRPIIIIPKRASLGEHRNEHQLATAKWLGQKQGITVAWDEKDLLTKLDQEGGLCTPTTIASQASPELIATIRNFIAKSTQSKSQDASQHHAVSQDNSRIVRSESSLQPIDPLESSDPEAEFSDAGPRNLQSGR